MTFSGILGEPGGDTDRQFCEEQPLVILCWNTRPPIVIFCRADVTKPRVVPEGSHCAESFSGVAFSGGWCNDLAFTKSHIMNSNRVGTFYSSRVSVEAVERHTLRAISNFHSYEKCHCVLF